MPEPTPFRHFIFVDFENVPGIDLAAVKGKPVHVTLLLGEKQKRLELALVRQIHDLGREQVELIEVGASGRNALDLVLAAHLGRCTLQHPNAEFVIISKDKDFDPLIRHLLASKLRVERHPDFSALVFLGAARPKPAQVPAPTNRAPSARVAAPARQASSAAKPAPPPADKFEKLVARLQSHAGPRPKRKDRLLHHIGTAFGNKLTEPELETRAEQLVRRGVLVIDRNDKVTYPGHGGAASSRP
ncbi:MAG TPA: PIN domain-containing protein [Opitutaceae bacterium]|nr:PIN domain-containing protein [Opitutaceae bacterium]